MEKVSKIMERFLLDFKKLPKKNQHLILIVLIICFVIGIASPNIITSVAKIGVKKTVQNPSPTPIPIPATLSLDTDKKDLKQGDAFEVTISINSPNQGVEAADFVVKFDPDYLSVATISAGNYFGAYPITQSEKGSVRLSGVATLNNTTLNIPKGRGAVGTIFFTADKTAVSTNIYFDREKTIVANNGKNILDLNKITDLKISIR